MTPQQRHRPFVPENVQMKEFTLRAVAAGAGDDGGPGRGQRVPGPARGHDHRGHLSGGGHRHGGAARVQGIDSRREHRANRGFHRRIGRGGRDLHAARVPDRGLLDLLRSGARLLEIDRADDGRQHSRRAVRIAGAARAGGRSRAALSRNRWRLRRFTKPDRRGRGSRAISCSGTSAWARWCRSWAKCSSTPSIRISSCASAKSGRASSGLGPLGSTNAVQHRRDLHVRAPTVSPAYMGVGYVIGPELAALQLLGRRAGVGLAGAAVHVFPGAAVAEFLAAGSGRRVWMGRQAAVCGATSSGRSRWAE